MSESHSGVVGHVDRHLSNDKHACDDGVDIHAVTFPVFIEVKGFKEPDGVDADTGGKEDFQGH